VNFNLAVVRSVGVGGVGLVACFVGFRRFFFDAVLAASAALGSAGSPSYL